MTLTEIAHSFLQHVSAGNVAKAFEEYTSPDFIHHNQYFKGGRTDLQQAMAEAHAQSPNKSIVIKHTYTDQKTVITHSLVTKAELEIAVVHIFRFEAHKIVELWDLGQVIEKNGPNQYGLF